MIFQVEVFWVVTCTVVEGYQSFGIPRWYPTTKLHGVTTQKTSTWNITPPLKAQNKFMIYSCALLHS